mgnify:CR=1 FL=1|jgi:hypothetical protein
MRFSILWASLSPAIFGTAIIAYHYLTDELSGPLSPGLGAAAMLGTLVSLPLVILFLVCATLVAVLLRPQPFFVQFVAFGLLAATGFVLLTQNPVFWELYGGKTESGLLIRCGASLATALICMTIVGQVRAK